MGKRRRTMSTRVRILAAILVVAAAGMAIAGGVTFTVQHERIVRTIDDQLRHSTSVIEPSDRAGSAEYLSPNDFDSVAAYLAEALVRAGAGADETVLTIIDGSVTSAVGAHGAQLSHDAAFIRDVMTTSARAGSPTISTADTTAGTVRFIAATAEVPGDTAAGLQVRAIDMDASLADLGSAVLTYTITAVSALTALALAGWLLIGRLLLSPMRSVQQTADAITLSDLHQRVPADGDGEVSEVGRTVNDMLDRLEGSVDVQRRLLDDVRHELKTPITIVRGHLEMMNVDDRDDVVTTRDIGMSELDRMARLVEDIDLLAAVEDDEYTMGLVDIATLTGRVGDLVMGIPGHRWRVLDRAAVVVRGNPDRLLQAWLALSDNAAKYTPEGSPIELGSTIVGGSVHLWLRDHGPGIPAASRHRIFRRFDRGGGRRDVGGTGLGLAIVDAIARAHGGSCTVTDTPGGGATFVIRIPVTLSNTAVFPAPKRAGDLIQQWEETG